jgi:hypothetical protein
MNSDKNRTQTAESIAQILVNVLIRRFTEDREATGAEKSGISPQRMD